MLIMHIYVTNLHVDVNTVNIVHADVNSECYVNRVLIVVMLILCFLLIVCVNTAHVDVNSDVNNIYVDVNIVHVLMFSICACIIRNHVPVRLYICDGRVWCLSLFLMFLQRKVVL